MYGKLGKNLISNNMFKHIPKRGYKMTKLHFYTGAGFGTPSGIKACIFGATASIGRKVAAMLLPRGVPCVMAHRNPLDVFCPVGDDPVFSKSNPYHTTPDLFTDPDCVSTVKNIFEI
jgi:hypothetical protein